MSIVDCGVAEIQEQSVGGQNGAAAVERKRAGGEEEKLLRSNLQFLCFVFVFSPLFGEPSGKSIFTPWTRQKLTVFHKKIHTPGAVSIFIFFLFFLLYKTEFRIRFYEVERNGEVKEKRHGFCKILQEPNKRVVWIYLPSLHK